MPRFAASPAPMPRVVQLHAMAAWSAAICAMPAPIAPAPMTATISAESLAAAPAIVAMLRAR